MRTHIRLGKIFGIEIGLHLSWFLIAFLIVLMLGSYFETADPSWGDAVVWSLAALTGLLFFVSLVLHELAHSLVAKSYGLSVRSITLFALGGVAQIDDGSAHPRSEFWIAIAGPILSFVVGGAALGTAFLMGWNPMTDETTPLLAMLVWLGYINIMLALFNLIPGFPLDGGRILRAVIWWKTGDEHGSSRSAARIGQFVGMAFIAWGLLRFFSAGFAGGLWIALIGWFLFQVAGQSHSQASLLRALEGVRVGDIMARDCPTVDGYTSVQDFVREILLHTERRCFVVETNGSLAGIVGTSELQGVERTRWPYTTLSDIVTPIDEDQAVNPETPVSAALEKMARDRLSQLAVISQGHLDGVLSRRQVAKFLQTRTA
ncbi:MAG TPA: site-2 protease family protein [Bryobacteraceae bacterium]|nr:site-2 protease family protein [Bryobacteraceae bacterium]